MMLHLRSRTVIVGLVPALLTMLVACGGGSPTDTTGTLSLEEYFDQVEDALARAEATPLEAPFPGETLDNPDASLDEKKQAVKDFISSHLAIGEQLVADLESLDPPPEAEDGHQDWLLTWKGANLRLEDFRDEVDALDSDADLRPMMIDEAFAEAFAALQAPCEDLQVLADSNDIDVQLNCSNQ